MACSTAMFRTCGSNVAESHALAMSYRAHTYAPEHRNVRRHAQGLLHQSQESGCRCAMATRCSSGLHQVFVRQRRSLQQCVAQRVSGNRQRPVQSPHVRMLAKPSNRKESHRERRSVVILQPLLNDCALVRVPVGADNGIAHELLWDLNGNRFMEKVEPNSLNSSCTSAKTSASAGQYRHRDRLRWNSSVASLVWLKAG